MKLATSLALLFLVLAPGCSGDKQTPEKSEASTQETEKKETLAAAEKGAACTVKMNVEGMACNVGCPPVVKKTLMSVTGVDSVDVSFEKSLATIKANGEGCEENGKNAMVEALKAKDYKASVQAEAEAGTAEEKDPS